MPCITPKHFLADTGASLSFFKLFFDNYGIRLRPSRFLSLGQVRKGIRWMPGYAEAMKDVVNCDKPRGAVNTR
jgi:hypothetical protein